MIQDVVIHDKGDEKQDKSDRVSVFSHDKGYQESHYEWQIYFFVWS
jgi:hypothetical protein